MDSQDLRAVATTSPVVPPEEAAQNINRSKMLDMTPDSYGELKTELEPQVKAVERIPAQVGPITKEQLTQSKQHFALGQDDVNELNTAEDTVTHYKNKFFEEPNLRRDRNELARKKAMNGGVLDEAEEELLQDRNAALQEMGKRSERYKSSDTMKFVSDVVTAGIDMVRTYTENLELVGLPVAAGAVLTGVGAGLATAGNPAAIIGAAKIGGGAGLATAVVAVPFVDSYKESFGSIYNDLTYGTDDKGEPLKLSEERRLAVSNGVALISGTAAALAGKVFASNNPFLKKLVNPTSAAKYVISNPAMMAKVDILGGIIKSGAAEGFEEGVQQIVESIALEFGQMDGSEESFMNALDKTLLNSKLWKEAGYSALVGAGAGGGIATATNLPGYSSVKENYEQIKSVGKVKQEVLETQNMLIEANAILANTKTQKLAPDEARTFKQNLFEKLGFEANTWFTTDDLNKFAMGDEKKASKIKNIISINPELVKLAQDTNSSIPLSKADVLEIMTEFPDISEFMRNSPDGQSPFEIRDEAKNFSENLTKADERRAAMLQNLGLMDTTELSKKNISEALGELKDSPYFESEIDYLENSIVNERDGILTKEQAEVFNTDYLGAKLEVAKSLKAEVDSSFNGLENRAFKETNDIIIQQEIKETAADLDLLDRFTGKKSSGKSNRNATLRENHTEVGKFSPYAIDPRYLPDNLREAYVNDPKLQERKAFVVGGLTPDEAAMYMGVESGEVLLKKLANIPDRQSLKNRKKQREISLKAEIDQAFKPERLAARDEAFSNLTKIHIREMDYMTKKEWPTLKRGIIKIAGKVPTIEALNQKAQTTINGMKVRDINPTQFKQGEARSAKAAVKQFLGGEFEQAFANKEKAAFNSELMKESLKARDKVVKFQKFWKKATDASSIQELKDAGYDKVMNEYMSLYKLDGNVKTENEQKSFNNWIKKQAAEGKPVPFIPKRLNNTQASFKDLTVEQYQTITEFGEYILDQAKTKNKMLADQQYRKELRTQETIAEEIAKLTSEHVDFDPNKAKREEKSSKDADFITNIQNNFKTLASSVNNTKNIVMELDNNVAGGFFYKTFVEPLVRSQTGKRQDTFSMIEYTKGVIKEFYGSQKNYDQMVNERLDIPEFANIDTLNNGQVRKIDLMRMMAFIGDPDGRTNIENYVDKDGVPLSFETVMMVLDREISEKEAGFVQNFFVNPYKRFEAASAALHKRTTGIDPEMIQGVPFTHKGKVYEGGYQPLGYQRLPDEVRAGQELEKISQEGVLDESGFFARMRATENTKQDRLKQRTGSKRPMQLDFEDHFNALEDIIHDLHFRETGIDLMKIMKSPQNVKNMKSVVGSKKFVLMLDSIKDVVSKSSDKESPLHREQNSALQRMLAKGKSLHAIKTIAFNIGSAAIQWDSLIYMPLRSGAKTPIYLAKTVSKMTANLVNYQEMVDLASQILPDIKFEQDAIDDSLTKTMDDFIPHGNVFFKNYKKLGERTTRILQLRRKALNASFFMLKRADQFNKVVASLALSDQFLNGDIEGYDVNRVNAMSDAEKRQTMQAVVKQIVDLSLTASSRLDKSTLEKNKVAQLFVNYWTDRRSRLNSITSQAGRARRSFKKGEYNKGISQLALLGVVAGTSAAFMNALRGEDETLLDKFGKIKNSEDAGMFALESAFDFAAEPAIQAAQSVPGVDAMMYAYESTVKYGRGNQVRPVSVPLLGVATDVVAGFIAMKDLLSSGLDFKRMKKKDRKALLTAGGYLVGGAPTNMINKAIDATADRKVERNVKEILDDIVTPLNNLIKDYNEEYKDVPEAQEFLEDLNEYQKTIPQTDNDVTHIMPENTKETMKIALSGGDWTKFDENTGAVGIYQYTEERWKERMTLSPELGLTENGRIARDPAQQERAMEREIQDNTKTFMEYGIPVTEENLLGAHKYGIDNYLSILEADDNKKLSEALGTEANKPEFSNFIPEGSATSENGIVASEELFDFIRGEETFEAKAYMDQGGGKGVKSIGYGNTRGDMSRTVTKEDAEADMREHVAEGQKELSERITRKDLTQSQMNVLLDMHYNLGINNMKAFIAAVNKGTPAQIEKSLKQYVRATKRDEKGNIVRDKDGNPVRMTMGGLVKRTKERLAMWKDKTSPKLGDNAKTVKSVKNYLSNEIRKAKQLTKV